MSRTWKACSQLIWRGTVGHGGAPQLMRSGTVLRGISQKGCILRWLSVIQSQNTALRTCQILPGNYYHLLVHGCHRLPLLFSWIPR